MNHNIKQKNEKAVESEYVISFVMDHAIEWGFDPAWLQPASSKKLKDEQKQLQTRLQHLYNHQDALAPRWQRRNRDGPPAVPSPAPVHGEDPSDGSGDEDEDHSDS